MAINICEVDFRFIVCKLNKCLSKKKAKDIQLIPEWDAFSHTNGKEIICKKGNYQQRENA